MENNWFPVNRKLLDSHLWLRSKFTQGQAWVDLIGLANYEDGYLIISGEKVPIKRGQCGWSMLSLSKRWKWSRGKIKRFINELENEHKIEQQNNPRTTLITIINYDKYQKTVQPIVQPIVQQTDTNNKNKRKYYKKEIIKEKSFQLPPREVVAGYMEEVLRRRYLEVVNLDDLTDRYMAWWEVTPRDNWKLAACTWMSNGALWGEIKLDDARIDQLPRDQQWKIRSTYYKKWDLKTWQKKINANEKTAQDMCNYNAELYSKIF